MRLGTIHPAAGSTRPTKRRGKGAGSGLGGTAGKGHKGKKARAGGKIPAWFEGGQMPIQRRTPKRGFVNHTRVEYQPVAVARLGAAEAGTVVDRDWLRKAGLVRGRKPVKLLGGGQVQVALTVRVDAASESAKKAIEGVGGKIEKPVKS
jgi:large subunit ribosomal protein L15